MNTELILKYTSLSAAQRKAISGFDSIVKELKKPGLKLVIVSNEASDRTKKQINNKCNFYNVPLVQINTPMDELGKSIGKSQTAIVLLTNPELVKQIINNCI